MAKRQIVAACVSYCLLTCVGCADDSDDSRDSEESGGSKRDASMDTTSSQTPPQGAAAVEAWLNNGDYKDWHCESDVHASRSPSPHGFNRICSNDLIAKNAGGTHDWPAGAAAVKELYSTEDDDEPAGYSVYLKTKSNSADGSNWYWYERLPGSDDAVADGLGDKGTSKSICVNCHVAAGRDAAHTPTSGGRDQVYTPVM